ncbi:MAG: hypothetical protein P1U40_07505 [Coxiellaceae bacterium]|nr:hypothetical protein [Coxiellaceae bacterium]
MREMKSENVQREEIPGIIDTANKHQHLIDGLKSRLSQLHAVHSSKFKSTYTRLAGRVWMAAKQLPLYVLNDQQMDISSLACGPGFLRSAIENIEKPLDESFLQRYVELQQSEQMAIASANRIQKIMKSLLTDLDNYCNPKIDFFRSKKKISVMSKLYKTLKSIPPSTSCLQYMQALHNGLVETRAALQLTERENKINPGSADKILEKHYQQLCHQQTYMFDFRLVSLFFINNNNSDVMLSDNMPGDNFNAEASQELLMEELHKSLKSIDKLVSEIINTQRQKIKEADEAGDMRMLLGAHIEFVGVTPDGVVALKEDEADGLWMVPTAVRAKPAGTPPKSPPKFPPGSNPNEILSTSYEGHLGKMCGSFTRTNTPNNTPRNSDIEDAASSASASASASGSVRSDIISTTPERRQRERSVGVGAIVSGASQGFFAEGRPKQTQQAVDQTDRATKGGAPYRARSVARNIPGRNGEAAKSPYYP